MWTIRSERLANCNGVHFAIDCGGSAATFTDAVAAWQSDAGFRTWFNNLLAGVEFESFRWETPAVTTATRSQPFEFVALDSPAHRLVELTPFSSGTPGEKGWG